MIYKQYDEINGVGRTNNCQCSFWTVKTYIQFVSNQLISLKLGKVLTMLVQASLLVLIAACYGMRDQSYAIRGKLMCGAKPAANVRVKLWEEDSGPDPDDLLEAGYTDANGEFSLSGTEFETTPIDPVFKVYHSCDDKFKPGKRKVKFLLPKSYITQGKVPKKVFDIGVLNLETIFPKEEREFIVTRRRRDKQEMSDDSDSFDYYSRVRQREEVMFGEQILLLLASVVVLQALLHQSLSIRGVLRCRSIPLANKGVQLYEKRSAILGNALIVGNRTDENGEFYLNGSTSRLLPISPLLHIDSDCKGQSHDVKLPSLKPQVTRGKVAKHTIDIGVINLL
ncbi:unnamed protein product [Cylicocyclus nassatus]|uniref:Transthyretin-like family protein n=1 Tax=Cylicocyclus nassatus TaxID=53992 RepID=A0AA36DMI3_CYLNA|nr:unnamed protein product [Cylicocyclus nassatus]